MIYLDNAATSHPKPQSVYERMDRFIREVGANPGRSGHRLAVEAEAEIDNVRRLVADLFGSPDPRSVVFTLNATDALNMIFHGTLKQGDHVVTTLLEHNSVSRPLAGMEQVGLISVSRVKSDEKGLLKIESIEQAITDKTRMVVLGHANNVTGLVAPVGDIGAITRSRDVLLVLDGAQSAGLIPIDMKELGVDILAFTGHKALMGPVGTGGLVVGERASIRPWREGGTGGDSASPLQPSDMPFRLEAGTPNTAGIAGLGEALRWIHDEKLEVLGGREKGLSVKLWDALSGDDRFVLYGEPPGTMVRTGVISLNIKGRNPAETGAILDSAFDIAVRTGLHCAPGTHRCLGTFPGGTVRVSPGPFNDERDIDALVAALVQIASDVQTGKAK